ARRELLVEAAELARELERRDDRLAPVLEVLLDGAPRGRGADLRAGRALDGERHLGDGRRVDARRLGEPLEAGALLVARREDALGGLDRGLERGLRFLGLRDGEEEASAHEVGARARELVRGERGGAGREIVERSLRDRGRAAAHVRVGAAGGLRGREVGRGGGHVGALGAEEVRDGRGAEEERAPPARAQRERHVERRRRERRVAAAARRQLRGDAEGELALRLGRGPRVGGEALGREAAHEERLRRVREREPLLGDLDEERIERRGAPQALLAGRDGGERLRVAGAAAEGGERERAAREGERRQLARGALDGGAALRRRRGGERERDLDRRRRERQGLAERGA